MVHPVELLEEVAFNFVLKEILELKSVRLTSLSLSLPTVPGFGVDNQFPIEVPLLMMPTLMH